MKSFIFESIWILSFQDQKAREVGFHPQKNLIFGQNHTGKSTLIKTLFLTLGCKAQGALTRWDNDAVSLVSFLVDQTRYFAIHQRGNRALFNSSKSLIGAAHDSKRWTELFAAATGFNLVLTDKDSNTLYADPKCFFIPFYINQDGSWGAKWDTFFGVQQYHSPVGPILDYFAGIKPPEYYQTSAEKTLTQSTLEDFQKEYQFLDRARERFGKSLSFSGPKVEPANFESEIVRLTLEVSELNRKQESLRDVSVREQETLANIQLQIKLARESLLIYEKDSSYLQNGERELLVCPTCGAEHSESFMEILTYAEDARVLRELVARLSDDAHKAAEQVRKTRIQLNSLESGYRKIAQILEVRKGELKFSDVVNSMGAESAYGAFEAEGVALKKDIDAQISKIEVLDRRLKELTNAARSKEILDNFRNAYAAALYNLNMPSIETAIVRL